jgi:hypothetical protein
VQLPVTVSLVQTEKAGWVDQWLFAVGAHFIVEPATGCDEQVTADDVPAF